MSLSAEAQALFDHARNSIPRWLTRGKNTALEWLYGFTDIFDASRTQAQSWLDITYILQAFGANLDQHAKDRGTARRASETDLALQQRLINITDAVTEPALKTIIDSLLDQASLGPCTFVVLRRDRAHFQMPGSSLAFMSRGYRITNAGAPMGYVVILPYGTTSTIGKAVTEFLRQFGPGGFNYYVEIRANP